MCLVNILENVNSHEDLARLSDQQREELCREIRSFLVSNIAKTGGHLASNLGVVELSVALETVFDTSIDRLVFDVGHQSYVHKMLTGRQADFAHLRQFGGMAGFPKPGESKTDSFVAGHASSSVSIALGMARARTLLKQNYNVVALLGDGASTGGMVYEGLNDAAVSGEPLIVVLNDNAMSIDRNVGGIATHLMRLRTTKRYFDFKKCYKRLLNKLPYGKALYRLSSNVKGRLKRALIGTTIFENMGFAYLGPVDGHDLPNLIQLLQNAKEMACPVLIHVRTLKGKGYLPAEVHPSMFHGIGQFDPASGNLLKPSAPSFSSALGEEMLELAHEVPNLCAITAAMPSGTGLSEFKHKYPERTFDVGIAEEHAVSMAGGLAKQGMVPVVAIYSTFLQRSFDQIMQDIALLRLHVVLGVDRAGLVGEDGETHHGVFDVGYLHQIPHMTILAPANRAELKDMLRWAVKVGTGPIALRYPRGGDGEISESAWKDTMTPIVKHHSGNRAVLISHGVLTNQVLEAAHRLDDQGIQVTVLRMMNLFGYDSKDLFAMLPHGAPVFIFEETCANSGIHENIAWRLHQIDPNIRVYGVDLGAEFVTHGKIPVLLKKAGLDSDSIAQFVREMISNEN